MLIDQFVNDNTEHQRGRCSYSSSMEIVCSMIKYPTHADQIERVLNGCTTVRFSAINEKLVSTGTVIHQYKLTETSTVIRIGSCIKWKFKHAGICKPRRIVSWVTSAQGT